MVRLLAVLALTALALFSVSAPLVSVSADSNAESEAESSIETNSIDSKAGMEYWNTLVTTNKALLDKGMEGYFTTHTKQGDKLEKFGGTMIRKTNPDRVKFNCPSNGKRIEIPRANPDYAAIGFQCPEIRRTWIQELHQFGGKFPDHEIAFTDGAVDADDEEQSPMKKFRSHRNHKNCHHNKGTKVSVDVNVN